MLAADTAFAAMSRERGAQQAFHACLTSDGVVFRPTAVTGGVWFATHEQASGRLDWKPAAAAVDCAGGLAVTTGPGRPTCACGCMTVASGAWVSTCRRRSSSDASTLRREPAETVVAVSIDRNRLPAECDGV